MPQSNIEKGQKTSFPLKTSSLLLDTLAQPVPDQPKKGFSSLKKRAFFKYLSNKNVFPLVDLDSSLKKAYWNSIHCSDVLLQHDKTITGKYCNNRWCLVCNRIRTAKLINGYLPVITSDFSDPMFVTLTIPNVSGEDLRSTIENMIKTFIRINKAFRKRNEGLKGIRKLESTYRLKLKDYHPHFHFLIDGQEQGQKLINAWLEAYPEADHRGQDIRQADEGSLMELFKYSTKMTAEDSEKTPIPPEALDVIFKALYKIRTYQPINIKKVVPDEDISEIQAEQIEELKSAIDVWTWEQELKDWLNSSGEFLTEYVELKTENNEQSERCSHVGRSADCLSG